MVSPVEVVWTLLTATGAAISVSLLRDAIVDRRLVDAANNGARLTVARTYVRNESVRLAVQLLFFLGGISSLFRPEPPADESALRLVVTAAFIVAAGLLVLNSWLDRQDKRRLEHQLGDLEAVQPVENQGKGAAGP